MIATTIKIVLASFSGFVVGWVMCYYAYITSLEEEAKKNETNI